MMGIDSLAALLSWLGLAWLWPRRARGPVLALGTTPTPTAKQQQLDLLKALSNLESKNKCAQQMQSNILLSTFSGLFDKEKKELKLLVRLRTDKIATKGRWRKLPVRPPGHTREGQQDKRTFCQNFTNCNWCPFLVSGFSGHCGHSRGGRTCSPLVPRFAFGKIWLQDVRYFANTHTHKSLSLPGSEYWEIFYLFQVFQKQCEPP